MSLSQPRILSVARNLGLYIDKQVLIINKPPGIVSQATVTREGENKEPDALECVLDDLKFKIGLSSRPMPVHRLDKCTTGSLLLARTPQAARDLSQQFAARTVQKTYLALVRAGQQSFATDRGEIKAKLKIEDGRVSVSKDGKQAHTSWALVDSSPTIPLSLLQLTLHTGLKHQLRVHLAHVLNAPILGDTVYSRSDVHEKIRVVVSPPANRLFLHASHIAFFRYRRWGQAKRFRLGITAPLPQDFIDMCSHAGLTLNSRVVHGGMTVDGQPVSHDLTDVDGHWIGPKPP